MYLHQVCNTDSSVSQVVSVKVRSKQPVTATVRGGGAGAAAGLDFIVRLGFADLLCVAAGTVPASRVGDGLCTHSQPCAAQ